MSERLVVEKGPRQRRIEGVLYYILPPLIGVTCRYFLGQGPWQVPAIVGAFVILSLAGNAIAIRLGGELITPAERWRRSMKRIAATPLPSLLFWMFVFYLLLLAGLNAPMMRPRPSREELSFLLGLIFVGAAVSTGICSYYLRRRAAVVATDTSAPPPAESPWRWLVKAAPFRVIGVAGPVGGYLIARGYSGTAAFSILLAGSLAGLVVQSVVTVRLVGRAPLLWHNFSFGAALAMGVSSYGIYFAVLSGLMELVAIDAHEPDRILMAWIFAAGGFGLGLLFALVPWALARFNTVKVNN